MLEVQLRQTTMSLDSPSDVRQAVSHSGSHRTRDLGFAASWLEGCCYLGPGHCGFAGCFSLAAATHSRMRVASSLRTSTTDGGSSELDALRSRQIRGGDTQVASIQGEVHVRLTHNPTLAQR